MISSEVQRIVLNRQYASSTLTVTGTPLVSAEFDAGYLERLKSGDLETEKHFTTYFSNVIWLKLRNRVRARHLIDEIRQETFVRVLDYLRSGKRVDYPERFGAFVLGFCNNVAREVLRDESHHPQGSQIEEPRDDRVKFADDIVTEERKRMVWEVLAELSEKDRAVLRMVFLEEADRPAISRYFQVDSEYLRVLLHRAKRRFRDVVKKKGDGSGLP